MSNRDEAQYFSNERFPSLLFCNQITSTTGFETLWSTKGKSCRFSCFEYPFGFVPAANRGVSLE